MRLVFLCVAAMLLVSGCVTSETVVMEAQKTVAEQVDPQISKLKSQFAMIDMNCGQLEQQLAGLKGDLAAAKAELAAQKEGYAGTVSDIKVIVEKAVRALDAKITEVEAGMIKMKADIAAAASAAKAAQAAQAAQAPAAAAAPAMQ
jgi:outer membrane murein-binding lipoprotein Lpp